MYPIRRAPRRGNPGNPFTPAELFRGGVNGVWFDPSDLNTLYQDAMGTIPVTAADQPVGLMLDKSVPSPKIANYFPYSADLTNSATYEGWTKVGVTVEAGFSDPFLGTSAFKVTGTGAASAKISTATGFTILYGKALSDVIVSAYVKAGTETICGFSDNSYGNFANFNLTAKTATVDSGGEWARIEELDNGWFRISAKARTASMSYIYRLFQLHNGSGLSGTGSTNYLYWYGPQLELSGPSAYVPTNGAIGYYGNHASQPTASKRPMLRSDGRLWWLEFDGVDDSMNTPSFLLTGDGQYSVAAGVSVANTALLSAIIDSDYTIGLRFQPIYTLSTLVRSIAFTSGGGVFAHHGLPVYNNISTVLSATITASKVEAFKNKQSNQGGVAITGALHNGSAPLYIGNSLNQAYPLGGKLYSAIQRAAPWTLDQKLKVESYIAIKAGVVF